MKRILVVLLASSILTGCGKPVPPEKASYVGEWRSPTMDLHITQDGSVAYERVKGGVTTKIHGPIQRFDGNDFAVGIAFVSTTFEVSEPPFQQDGQWMMVVDGEDLVKYR